MAGVGVLRPMPPGRLAGLLRRGLRELADWSQQPASAARLVPRLGPAEAPIAVKLDPRARLRQRPLGAGDDVVAKLLARHAVDLVSHVQCRPWPPPCPPPRSPPRPGARGRRCR